MKKSKEITVVILFFLFYAFLFSCVSMRPVHKPGFSLKAIKNIYVEDFKPHSGNPDSGAIFKDEITRQLMLMGFNVKDSMESVDAIITGTVTGFLPSKRYFVYSDPDNSIKSRGNIVISPAIVEVNDADFFSLGPAGWISPNAKIMVSNATAGLSVKLLNPVTKEVLWSYAFTYEALDIQSAVENVAEYIVKSLVKSGQSN